MSDNSYQYHTVVLVTIIISRRIDRGISNWSVPAVRIVWAVWVMGRIVWTPPKHTAPPQLFNTCVKEIFSKYWLFLYLRLSQSTAVVPNLGGIPPKGGIWPSLGGNEQLSKTIQHLFGLKIHLIYNYKASDSLNFHEIKFN